MGMTICMHTKGNHSFNAEGYIASNDFTKNYAVIKIESREKEYGTVDDFTLFPSFEQAKEMHKQLSKLMKEIKEFEKGKKENNQTESE